MARIDGCAESEIVDFSSMLIASPLQSFAGKPHKDIFEVGGPAKCLAELFNDVQGDRLRTQDR